MEGENGRAEGAQLKLFLAIIGLIVVLPILLGIIDAEVTDQATRAREIARAEERATRRDLCAGLRARGRSESTLTMDCGDRP